MKLSIIIPTLNVASTLPTLLNSIFTQDTEHDYEVIIIDGMSKDDTVAIAKTFNVKLIEKETTIYSAQNEGISASTGSHLYFIGADDVLVIGAIDAMLSVDSPLVQGLVYHSNRIPVYSKFQQGFVYSKELFERFGDFDLEHPVYADILFKKRLTSAGIKEVRVKKSFASIGPNGFSSKFKGDIQ